MTAIYIQAGATHWYPEAPRVEDVHVGDMANALSKVCRFGGHVMGDPYSVAEHLVRCHDLARSMGLDAATCAEALIHDAHEAYPPGDVASPLKRSIAMAGAVALEVRAEKVVRQFFGFTLPFDPAVRQIDLVMLATERRDLMAPSNVDWGGLPEPLAERIEPWTWRVARDRWAALVDAYQSRGVM